MGEQAWFEDPGEVDKVIARAVATGLDLNLPSYVVPHPDDVYVRRVLSDGSSGTAAFRTERCSPTASLMRAIEFACWRIQSTAAPFAPLVDREAFLFSGLSGRKFVARVGTSSRQDVGRGERSPSAASGEPSLQDLLVRSPLGTEFPFMSSTVEWAKRAQGDAFLVRAEVADLWHLPWMADSKRQRLWRPAGLLSRRWLPLIPQAAIQLRILLALAQARGPLTREQIGSRARRPFIAGDFGAVEHISGARLEKNLIPLVNLGLVRGAHDRYVLDIDRVARAPSAEVASRIEPLALVRHDPMRSVILTGLERSGVA